MPKLLWILAGLLVASPAFAEDTVAPAPPEAPGPVAAKEPAPPAAAPESPALADFSLLRVDVENSFALHGWLYHEFRLTGLVGVLATLHFATPGFGSAPFAELEVGPNFHVGPLQINPQIGLDVVGNQLLGVDPQNAALTWTPGEHSVDVIPQLYFILSLGRVNAEWWNLYFIPVKGGPRFYSSRLLANVRLLGGLAVGPHAELGWLDSDGRPARIAVGGDVLYTFRYGTVGLWAAYETEAKRGEFRLTFLKEL